MPQAPAEFTVDTPRLKRRLVRLAAFLVVGLCISSLIGGHSWPMVIANSLIFPSGFLLFFWCYCWLTMFDRSYTISDEGVMVSRRGQTLRIIPWDEVARVSKGNPVRVFGRDGRKIAFPLPPAIQRQALRLIEARLNERDNDCI